MSKVECKNIVGVQEGVINTCPDYDADCNGMNVMEANWCFMGCQNHPCAPNNNLGIAKGSCPIIHKSN
jgi:hypothetical protein